MEIWETNFKSHRGFLACLAALCLVVTVSCRAQSVPPKLEPTASQDLSSAENSSPQAEPASSPELTKLQDAHPLQADVADLVGKPFKQPVPTYLVDRDQSVDYALKRLAKMGGEEGLSITERTLKLFGMVPKDRSVLEDLLLFVRDQAGGYYDPDTDAFYILDELPELVKEVVAFHELVHAIEDQYYDLDALFLAEADNDDHSFAISATAEGSATLAMNAYLGKKMLRGELAMQELQEFMESEQERMESLKELPEVLVRTSIGPYALGPQFLRAPGASMMSLDWPKERIEAAYLAPPKSSEQILHPEKYWDPELRDDPIPVAVGPSPGSGWELKRSGVFGELAVASWLMIPEDSTKLMEDLMGLMIKPASAWTTDGAAGWGGDRWEYWQKGDEEWALYRAVWDSSGDAQEFVEALKKAHPSLETQILIDGDKTLVWSGSLPKNVEQDGFVWH